MPIVSTVVAPKAELLVFVVTVRTEGLSASPGHSRTPGSSTSTEQFDTAATIKVFDRSICLKSAWYAAIFESMRSCLSFWPDTRQSGGASPVRYRRHLL